MKALAALAFFCIALVACGGERDTVEFSNLRVEEIGATRAVIRFDTSLPTSCEVLYGGSRSKLDQSATDPDMEPGQLVTTHQVPLEDLAPDTGYFWRARAVDRENAVFLSEVDSFTTLTMQGSGLGANVALLENGAVVVAVSSNWGGGDNDSTYGANKAFDGQMTTAWSSAGDGDEAWVELDFGSERELRTFAFRSREMSDKSSIISKLQLVFDEGAETRGPFETPEPSERYQFELDPPVVAERVRLEALETSGGNTGAREIEFYE